jgi:putative peptidoglycan lipid II flippase
VEEPRQEAARAAGVPAAAVLLASSVLLSRVLGVAREMLLADRIGAGGAADAYYASFQLPDMMNYLLAGGALSIAFLPLYTRLRTERGEEPAERLLATVLGTFGLLAALATLALWLLAGPLVVLQFGGFDAPTRALCTRLTRIVLPAQVFFVVGGVVQATLFARGRFLAAALAPLLYNGSIIAGGLALEPWIGVEGFSWGVLAGAFLGPFLVPWLDARRRVRFALRVAPTDRDFLRYLATAAPLMVGQSLLTVDEWYGRWFGSRIAEGTIAHLTYARRLMQAPVAAVGQAIGTATLPALARLWAEGRRRELEALLTGALRAGLALGILAAAATFALANPLVDLLYRHGAFTAQDAEGVAHLLRIFSLAIPGWVGQQIAVRAFYARGDMWRPMLLGTVVVVAALPLYWELGQRFGPAGLAAAGALGLGANAALTLLWARALHGAPSLRALLMSAARAAAVACAAGAAGHAVLRGAAGATGAALDLATGGLVFAGAAAAGIALLGDDATRAAFRRLGRRLRRRRAVT